MIDMWSICDPYLWSIGMYQLEIKPCLGIPLATQEPSTSPSIPSWVRRMHIATSPHVWHRIQTKQHQEERPIRFHQRRDLLASSQWPSQQVPGQRARLKSIPFTTSTNQWTAFDGYGSWVQGMHRGLISCPLRNIVKQQLVTIGHH